MVATPDPDSPETAYGPMRWNTPLSEDHAGLLLDHLDEVSGREVLDLGCGWGELFLRAVARDPKAHGTGVDTAEWALTRGRGLAAERGLSDRVTFAVADAARWTTPCDRLLCVGASHAWGGSAKALHSLRRLVRPGGRVMFGDGCWPKAPTPAAMTLFGDDVLNLDDLVVEATLAGWKIVHMGTADQGEWDEFESLWRSGREHWLQAHPLDPRTDEIKAKLDDRLREYMTVYWSVLGFAYLILA